MVQYIRMQWDELIRKQKQEVVLISVTKKQKEWMNQQLGIRRNKKHVKRSNFTIKKNQYT